jgi:eukaryotic-like serine/threonine-protein kinase
MSAGSGPPSCFACGAAHAPGERCASPEGLRVGALIDGKYELVRLVGRGGMGEVYEGRHRVLGRRVAVKFILAEHAVRPQIALRFDNEARASGGIEHENVAAVYDVGALADGAKYLVMEFLEGEDVDSLARREAPLPPARAASIIIQACRGLDVVHRRGIVHRDLKPANLFLARRADRTDLVKVLDFGIAKHQREDGQAGTKTGAVIGTAHYMSPEQARGQIAVDARTDVYALGVILYELLSGRRPHEGDSLLQILHKVMTQQPVDLEVIVPGLPALAYGVVRRAMATIPAERYQTVAELGDALLPLAGRSLPPIGSQAGRGFVVPSVEGGPTLGTAPTRLAPPGATPQTASGSVVGVVLSEPGHVRRDSPEGAPGQRSQGHLVGLPSGPPATRRRRSSAAPLALLGAVLLGAGALAGVFILRGRWNARVPESPSAIPAPPSAAPVVERYSRVACGSIADTKTGLEWFVGPDRNTPWGEAWTWAPALAACNGGWRMPTIDELNTLFDPEHTAGTGYLRNGQRFPARLHPLFAEIGAGSWVWTNSTHGNAEALAYNFFTNGPVPIARDGSASGGLPHFTPRAFAVRGHAVTTSGDGGVDVAAVAAADPQQRALPLEDTGFVDTRGGWGWSDRCFVHIKAKNWGWAKAECDEGIKIADPTAPQPRAALLFNQGLIARAAGDIAGARRYLAASVSLSDNAGVRAMLASLPSP